MFDVKVDEQGTATIEVSLTITAPSMGDAHKIMRNIREAAHSHPESTAAQGDFITTISTVPDPMEEHDGS